MRFEADTGGSNGEIEDVEDVSSSRDEAVEGSADAVRARGTAGCEQVERAEQLLGEIDAAKRYPYEYLCYRITGFRPEGWPALVLEGQDVLT